MSWLEQLVIHAQGQLTEREREALWMRGVSDEQIALFRLGCVNKTLPSLEYPKHFLEWCWEGRRLDDVFLLPLTNTLGQVKGFQFRHVDRARKGYSDYLPFEDETVLFGLSQAMSEVWRTETIWLVEGAFDLFPVQRHRPNVVPTLTARLTQGFAGVLRRLVKDIWTGYDIDTTGRSGTETIHKTFGREFHIQTCRWPRVKQLDGVDWVKDPSDLWEVWGDDRLGVFIGQQDRRQHGERLQ